MHIVYAFAPGGGPEAYVRTLGPWLAARGHRVSLVCPAPLSTPFELPWMTARPSSAHYYLARLTGGFRAWPLRLRAWEQATAIARAVDRIAGQHPVDLVEVPEGLPAAPFARRPLVVRAHGAEWSCRYFCRDGNDRHDRHLIRQEAAQLRQADAVAAFSCHLADHLSTATGCPRARIRVIAGAINTDRFTPGAPAIEPGSRADPLIVSIGRLEPRKGTDVLVQAMRRVWQSFPGARLQLLGGATHFTPPELQALAPEARRGQLIFQSFVPYAALPEYYRAASLYVTASRFETFGFTVLEALASGRPVIATRVGALPELIEDGCNGLLVPPDDPQALGETLTALLRDGARMARLGDCARESAQAYALPKIGPQHERLYADAAESHAHRAR